ncbi:hypothetical protein ACFQ60_47545 [Streptomyces zhihengii]
MLDLDEAQELGLVTNGLQQQAPEPGTLKPLLTIPAHTSVAGTLDPSAAVRAFQRELRSQGVGDVLPDFAVGDLGGVRSEFNAHVTPHGLLAHYAQLVREEGVTWRHFHKKLVGANSGEVRVRLVPVERRFRRTRHNIEIEEQRSLTTASQMVTESEHREGVGISGLVLPGLGTNDDKGKFAGPRLAIAPQAAVTASSSRGRTVQNSTTDKRTVTSKGLHAEFDVQLDLELSYTRADGQHVTVRKPAGSVIELHAVPLLQPDAGRPERSAEAAPTRTPVADAASEDALDVDTAIEVKPATAASSWDTFADERILAVLRSPDVAILNIADAQRLQRHVEAVTEHAVKADRRRQATDADKKTAKLASLIGTGSPINSKATKHRWGKAAPSAAITAVKMNVGSTTLTRPGTAPHQQVTQQFSSHFLPLTAPAPWGRTATHHPRHPTAH